MTEHGKLSKANGRPSHGKLRRRSTLRWTGASPEMRQKKLEDVAREKMADAWFSLSVEGVLQPVYISEVVEKSMNPDFCFFDLKMNGPRIARADGVQLKLWAKTDRQDDYALLTDLDICLRSLQFIGKSLDNFHQPLPANCVLFHFEDGIYTSFTDMPVEEARLTLQSTGAARAGGARTDTTSSYGALMQLANVDDCIQDALATRTKLEGQINGLLSRNRESLELVDKNERAQEAVNSIHRACSTERRQIRLLNRRRDDIHASLELRKKAIKSGLAITQTRDLPSLEELQTTIVESKRRSRQILDERGGQIRRVCEELSSIYQLEPIKNWPLHFSILHLYLPNSVFDDSNRDEIAAALGFTSKLTQMLSLYLSIPLPYPISPQFSTSTIEDPISLAITQRTFPLYPTNVSYKFEYGVFLLNKDIECLMHQNGLQILDIRQTLPNLKYLLFVLTAGTGDLPARRAGGVRALAMKPVSTASTSRSRSGSEGSGKAAVHGQGHSLPTEEDSKEKPETDLPGRLLSTPTSMVQLHRNGSLREAF